MARPRRLYINSKGKYYYIVNGIKKFIKVPQGMSQQQIQNINIKNIIAGPARRLKRRTKKIVPVYSKKIAKGEDMEKSVIKTEGGLPAYVFTPQKKFLSIGDLTTKSDDTSNDKLINLLKGAIPVIAEGAKKLALPAPEQKFLLGDADKEFINDMIEGKLIESEPALRELIRRETKPPPISKSDVQKENERIRKEIEDRKGSSRTGTPFTSAPASPLLDEDEEGKPLKPPASFTRVPPKALPVQKAAEESKKEPSVYQFLTQKRLENALGREWVLTTFPGGFSSTLPATDFRTIARKLGIKADIVDKTDKKDLIILIKEDLTQKGFGDNGDDGLYNDQIEKIMKKRIKNFVPVVASDKVNDLLQHVNKGDKFFSAVINTEPSESFGRHWRCIVIDNRDDYPSAEYFDSLAENAKPDDALLSVMRKICKRMNPEKYFKFKYNMLRRQSFNTSNCSYHVMKFIEDRHNGVPFEDASGWSDYMKRQKGNGYEAIDDSQDGEGDLEKYQNKIKKLFKSYL
jgi:hypothetical protein